jgi:hypothetical protein
MAGYDLSGITGNESYMDYLNMQSYENPFAGYNPGADQANAVAGSQYYNGQIANAQSKLDGMAAESAAYPTFSNPYGIGSQQPFGSASSSTDKSASTANPAAANRGFNPWSLVGESNAR